SKHRQRLRLRGSRRPTAETRCIRIATHSHPRSLVPRVSSADFRPAANAFRPRPSRAAHQPDDRRRSTRRPTAYGTSVAGRLAKDLAGAGLTITSGMARGIDTAAHKAALEAAGDTIAVFGCGVDQVYPSENRKLADQIAEKGLIISEFPM